MGKLKVVLLALLVVVLAVPGLAFADRGGPPAQQSLVRKIVIFTDETYTNEPAVKRLLELFDAIVIHDLPLVTGKAVALPLPAVEALRARPEVVRIDDDAIVYALPTLPEKARPPKPNPTPVPEALPWGVDKIDADEVWDTNHDLVIDPGANVGAGVKVAVLDTGIDLDHPDLAANIAGGINTINPLKSADDDNGHGTHVAGIIAGADNAIGILGVAPQASLYAVKVLNAAGSGYVSDVIEGLQWSIANGMQVVNMSLGTNSDILSLHEACDKADAAGIVLVAAAGNDGAAVDYPAAYTSVIAVAATDSTDTRPSWSSYGSEVELAAPGVYIYSTYKGGTYATLSGTSMAAPHVAGTAALVIKSGITNNGEVRAKLTGTADDLGAPGADNYYGAGLVDAQEAATGTQS